MKKFIFSTSTGFKQVFYAKDMILQNYQLEREKTTEAVLNIPAQPEDTCPMIDDAQGEIDGLISGLKAIADESFMGLSYRHECSYCSNAEIYSDNLRTAENITAKASAWIDELKSAKQCLESFRTDCVDTRAHGEKIKAFFWDLIELDFSDPEAISKAQAELISFEKSFPAASFARNKYKAFFPDEALSFPRFHDLDACENEDCPFQSRSFRDDFETLEQLLPSSTVSVVEYDAAQENLDSIEQWSINFIERSREVLEKKTFFEELISQIDLEEIKKDYESDRKKRYVDFWKKEAKSRLVIDEPYLLNKIPLLKHHFVEHKLALDLIAVLKRAEQDILLLNVETDFEEHTQVVQKKHSEIYPKYLALQEFKNKSNLDVNHPYNQELSSLITNLVINPLLWPIYIHGDCEVRVTG